METRRRIIRLVSGDFELDPFNRLAVILYRIANLDRGHEVFAWLEARKMCGEALYNWILLNFQLCHSASSERVLKEIDAREPIRDRYAFAAIHEPESE